MARSSSAFYSFLICRCALRLCALPLAHVAETMRALPIEPLPAMPPFLFGVSLIRGRAVLPQAADCVTITALDINPAMLQKAQRARYSRWSLREFPVELTARWFKPEGADFVLDEAIRRAVKFICWLYSPYASAATRTPSGWLKSAVSMPIAASS